MAKLKTLPKLDRPREKALRYGISSLSDSELLALLLNSGYKGNNILEISTSLLTKYGGIVGLLNIPITELKKNKGIKDVGALKIALIGEFYKRIVVKFNIIDNEIIDDEYLYNKYKSMFYLATQEHLMLVILNKRKRIIYETNIYKGQSDSIQIDFKDIYKELAKYDGKNFYLIHNHPSGDCSPSEEDIQTTLELLSQCRRMKVKMLDHLIIGDGSYYSFKKMKKITIYS